MLITIFTPTYNRGYIIRDLFESLQKQTFRDFEWLVIDDGSSDNTEDIFSEFQANATFPIRYIKTENGGKHRAINKAVKIAAGELFFIVDSDDYLTPNSLERVAFWYETMRDDETFCGLSGLRISPDNQPFDLKKKFNVIDCTDIEIRKYLAGDRAQVYLTNILKQFPFPEYPGEKFISEGVVWSRMAQKYKVRFFCEGIYVAAYREDGLTYSIRRNHRLSPMGSMVMFKEKMIYDTFYIEKIKAGINYWRSSIDFKGRRLKELKMPWYGYIFYIPGLIFHYYDIWKERKNETK